MPADMVDKGAYDSSMLLSEVQAVFGVDESGNQIMTNKNVSVLYGYSHDKDVNDDAGICPDNRGLPHASALSEEG